MHNMILRLLMMLYSYAPPVSQFVMVDGATCVPVHCPCSIFT